jgi:hypothetical protein
MVDTARLAAVVTAHTFTTSTRFPALTTTAAGQVIGACVELACGPVVVVMAAAPRARPEIVARIGEGMFVGRMRPPPPRSGASVVIAESAARTVEVATVVPGVIAAFPPGGGMQPLATVFQVLRAGFQQALSHSPEFADAGDIAAAVGALAP